MAVEVGAMMASASLLTIQPVPIQQNRSEIIDEELEKAREALVAQIPELRGFLRRIVMRKVGNLDDADDIAQETLAIAWERLGGFRQEATLRNWLATIALNRATSIIRERIRSQVIQLSGDEEFDGGIAPPDESAREGIFQRELQEAIRSCLLEITPSYRAVLELYHFQDLSYQEIATTLNISVALVRTRLSRGRAAMRDAILARYRDVSRPPFKRRP